MRIVSARTGHCHPAAGLDDCSFVELTADCGASGTACGAAGLQAAVEQLAGAVVDGADPQGLAMLWPRLCEAAGQDGQMRRAAAMLDLALWDLVARNRGEPMWKSLGGTRPRLNACLVVEAADSELPETLAGAADAISKCGFRAARLNVGHGVDAALEVAGILHAALSHNALAPELLLSMPADSPLEQVVNTLRTLEERLDVVSVQVSGAGWDNPALGRLSASIRAAVAFDSGQPGAPGLFRRLDHNGADVLVIDPEITGVSGAMQVAEAAYGYELPVILSPSPGNAAVHVGSVVPTLMYQEVRLPHPASGGRDLAVRVDDGWLVAGEEAGHGLELGGKGEAAKA